MERPMLHYKLTKSERYKFDRQCHAWDLARRITAEPTEADVEKAYTVLSYIGRLANLEHQNSINDNTISMYDTLEHRNNLLRAEKGREKAKALLAPYNATITYFGHMPTVVDINKTNKDLMVGHW